MSTSKSRLSASMYATMSISFWGVSFVSTKAVLGKLDPYSLLVLRFGIGALFLLLLLLVLRIRMFISLKHLPHLMILGIIGVFVHQVLQATALLTINASSAGWLISFSPIFTVILSLLFLHEALLNVPVDFCSRHFAFRGCVGEPPRRKRLRGLP